MAEINPRYSEYSMAVSEELSNNGFVLLGGALADASALEEALPALDWTREDLPDRHRLSVAEAPPQLVETIRAYVSSLGQELRVKRADLYRIGSGDFTLQHDEQPPAGLHALLFICPDGWDAALRGEVTYVPPSGDPLLIVPEDNALALVRMEEDWRTFIKRVNHYAEGIGFFVLRVVLA